MCRKNPALRRQWGCDGPGRFLYDLGGVVVNRCPLALQKLPLVQRSLQLYAFYRQGITPNGGGLRQETACYRACMMKLDALSAEAEGWYLDKTGTTKGK